MKRDILCILLCFVVGIFSHGKAFAGTNKLELQNITLNAGTTNAVLPIILTNEDMISGFQCDLYLPEGIEVGVDKYEDYLIDMSRTTEKRHSVSSRVMSDGALRLVCSSMTNATFSGNSGAVLTLTLKVKNDMPIGDYNISLKNIVLTDPSATRYTSDNVTISVSVTAPDFLRGDANGDGKVTITDAVAVVNYILNTTQGTFNVTAADVDGNGSITITDAVGIVNIILNSSSAGVKERQVREEIVTEREPD